MEIEINTKIINLYEDFINMLIIKYFKNLLKFINLNPKRSTSFIIFTNKFYMGLDIN